MNENTPVEFQGKKYYPAKDRRWSATYPEGMEKLIRANRVGVQGSRLAYIRYFIEIRGRRVSRQLRAWADSLQNSEIKRQRYLNEKERRVAQSKKEKEEFLETLKGYRK